MSLWTRDPYRLITEKCDLTAVLSSGREYASPSSVPSPRGVLEFPDPGESPSRKENSQVHLSSATMSSFLILVVDPGTKAFEFVQVQHNIYSAMTINEVILEVIPQSAKDQTLANIPYRAICDCHGNMFNRATQLSDIVKIASRKQSIPTTHEKRQVILVAVPSSSTLQDSTKFAHKILCHPGIINMLKTNGIDVSSYTSSLSAEVDSHQESVYFVDSKTFATPNLKKWKKKLSLSLPSLSFSTKASTKSFDDDECTDFSTNRHTYPTHNNHTSKQNRNISKEGPLRINQFPKPKPRRQHHSHGAKESPAS